MKKTSVELKEEKILLAKKLGGISTLKDLLDEALNVYIANLKKKSMINLLGTNFFDGDLNKMRKRSSGNVRSGR